MSQPKLHETLEGLARIARGGADGLTVVGCAMLAQDLQLAAHRARTIEARAREAETDLVEYHELMQPELTAGSQVIMPRLFSAGFSLAPARPALAGPAEFTDPGTAAPIELGLSSEAYHAMLDSLSAAMARSDHDRPDQVTPHQAHADRESAEWWIALQYGAGYVPRPRGAA